MIIQKFYVYIFLQLIISSIGKAQSNHSEMKADTSLHYIVKECKEKTKRPGLLILLHGHGSNEYDLFSLGEKIPGNWMLVAIRGPFQLAENRFRWYDVKLVNGKISINIKEEETSRRKILQLISTIIHKFDIDSQHIVAAGFSQGAIMAQSLGLSEPNLITGFGVFSGRFVEEFVPYMDTSSNLKNSKAFIAHGSADQMLPKTYSEENIHKLRELGIKITYSEDTNGHSISLKQWDEFCNWLMGFE